MSDRIRQGWRRTSMSPPLARFTRWRVAVLWRLRGSVPPPPHVVKQRVVLDYQRRGRFETFVETGTFTGEMLAAVRSRFRELISIELSPAIYEKTRERFAADPAIRLLLGDSGALLPRVLEGLDHRALFWLDGHYMGEGTGRGATDTPVRQELEALLRHPIRGHLVLIDDARLFDGTGGYPSIAALREWIVRERPGTTVAVEADIIRCALDGPLTVS